MRYDIHVVIAAPTPTPSTDNIVIFDRSKDGAVTNNGGKVYGDKSLFTQATIGKTLHMEYDNLLLTYGWYIEVRGQNWGNMNVAAWGNKDRWDSSVTSNPETAGSVDIVLTKDQVDMLASQGLQIIIYWMDMKYVDIR